jgi:hypothetical protein
MGLIGDWERLGEFNFWWGVGLRAWLPVLEVARFEVEGARFRGRSSDPSHPWLTLPNSNIAS